METLPWVTLPRRPCRGDFAMETFPWKPCRHGDVAMGDHAMGTLPWVTLPWRSCHGDLAMGDLAMGDLAMEILPPWRPCDGDLAMGDNRTSLLTETRIVQKVEEIKIRTCN